MIDERARLLRLLESVQRSIKAGRQTAEEEEEKKKSTPEQEKGKEKLSTAGHGGDR